MTQSRQLPSYPDYLNFTKVWMPKAQGDQAIFLVRVPTDLELMEFRTYLELMNCRMEWMFENWIKYFDRSKENLQKMLCDTLRQLHPTQEAPSLYDEEGEKQMWIWATEWAESLLEFNETWMQWMRLTNPEVSFPVDLTLSPPMSQKNLMEMHDEVTIDQFLMELRAEFK